MADAQVFKPDAKQLTEDVGNQLSAATGLPPIESPHGPDHHTEMRMVPADVQIGHVLAYFLGKIFADEDDDPANMSSFDVWSRIARGLRVHGLRVADARSDCSLVPTADERTVALAIANAWLDGQMNSFTQMVPGDPDCDACIVARALVRAIERVVEADRVIDRAGELVDY